MRQVKVIFFDAAGTLIQLPRGVGFHYADVASRHGWKVDAGALAKVFGAVWKALPPPVVTRQPRPDDDRDWWRELVARVLAAAGAPAQLDRDAFFAELYAEFVQPGVWTLYPEVLEVLDTLADRFPLAVLSNFDGRLRLILAQLGVLDRFQHLIISSEVGADKPDPWIFTHAADKMGVRPEEALLVGDDPECDIAGAIGAGWRAFHVDRPGVTLRDLLPTLSIQSRRDS